MNLNEDVTKYGFYNWIYNIFKKLEEEIEKLRVEKQYFHTKCEENEQLIQFLETQIKVYSNNSSISSNETNGGYTLSNHFSETEKINLMESVSLKNQITILEY